MPIQQVARYIASDGIAFDSREDAEAHEVALIAASDMDEFFENNEVPTRTANAVRKWIPIFIAQMDYIKAPQQVCFDATNSVPEETDDTSAQEDVVLQAV